MVTLAQEHPAYLAVLKALAATSMLHSKSLHACHHGPRRSARRQRKLVAAAAAAPIPTSEPHTHRTLSIEPIKKRIFIFGLGYTSVALANWLSAEGWCDKTKHALLSGVLQHHKTITKFAYAGQARQRDLPVAGAG